MLPRGRCAAQPGEAMRGCRILAWVAAIILLPCSSLVRARSQQAQASNPQGQSPAGAAATATLSQPPNSPSNSQDQQTAASISGTVVDVTGAAISGAQVSLTRGNQSPSQQTSTGQDGGFAFANVAPGPYTLTISATGFAEQSLSGTLRPGEVLINQPITVALATNVTEVQVTVPRAEVAEAEIKAQEKQRVLGVIPNFYVSYVPNAAPLNGKQKFELAWRTTIDPITILITGAAAGIEQSQDAFSGYGQGAQGYAKRFGASYADTVTGTFIGSALLPTLLKQDPRYFYKGTGTARSRLLYALVNAVICKGDNKRWQPNYSSIAGSFAAGGISNLYYPSAERGAENTVENALIAIGESAAANVFQEFLVKRFTPSLARHHPEKS